MPPSLDDLVTRRWDDTWGGALVPASVRSLPGGQGALRRTMQVTQATRRQDAARLAAKRKAAEEKRASELQLAWVNGSNSQQAIVLKHAVKRELSVTGEVWNPKAREAGDAEIEAARGAARMMYERTQEHFRTKGITKIRLYRGIQSDITGKNVIESWMTDLDTAQVFSKGYGV